MADKVHDLRPKLPDSEKIVLLALADCANDEGGCWPSMATLAKKCSKSDRTVQASIKKLVKAGHLTRNETPGKGCSYTVHPRSSFTPEAASPPKPSHHTPEAASDKPSMNHQSPTKSSTSTEKRARKVVDFPCPENVDPIDWQGLIANRKAKRAALSEGAHRQIIGKLTKWADAGWPPGPIVAHAAERGWTSVFETDEMKAGTNVRQHRQSHSQQTGIGRTMAAGANVLARYAANG